MVAESSLCRKEVPSLNMGEAKYKIVYFARISSYILYIGFYRSIVNKVPVFLVRLPNTMVFYGSFDPYYTPLLFGEIVAGSPS